MLILENISKTFDKDTINEKKALNNFSLILNEGDFVTVIGSNGAGKSTLFGAISGAEKVDNGNIYLNNKNITKIPQYKRAADISTVLQNPIVGTSGEMTIEENLSIAMNRGKKPSFKFGKKSKEVIKESLKLLNLGLEERLETKVSLLSGGQRQAISLLMATIKTPDLLLLDEHTSALDPMAAENILNVTDKLVNEKKITALMITHNMNDAIKYGNKLIMMHNGKVIFEASGEEKKSLTKDDLIEKFELLCKNSLSDAMMLS